GADGLGAGASGSTAVLPPVAGGGVPGSGATAPEAPTRRLPQRERGRSPLGDEPPGAGEARPASGPTVSARGPGGPEPDPPTARISPRKPRFRATGPEDEARPEDTGKGEAT
ncbi:hypothetical protein ACFQ8D_07085, partial [Streptomyces sp. NPDC056464]